MKITCLQENLKKSLNITQNIIGRNLTLPILNNVLLTTENGRLRISSTNLEIGINTWTTGKVEKNGAITCPAKILTSFINNLPNKKIELEVKDNTLIIKCDNYKASLNGLPADDFPIIPKIEEGLLLEVKNNIFKESLSGVIGSVSLSESRPEITGVLFNIEKQSLKLAATDSFRLAEKIIFDINKKSTEVKLFIIPQRTIQELIRVLSEKNGETKIFLGASQILFDSGEVQIISRLIDGQYPDYQQIIPKVFSGQAIVERSEFLNIIRAAAVFSSKTNTIKVTLDGNKVEVLSQDPDLGENKSNLTVKGQGKKVTIDFNYRYLLDGLTNINTKQIFLGLISDANPAVIKPIGDETYIYLVMPIRVS